MNSTEKIIDLAKGLSDESMDLACRYITILKALITTADERATDLNTELMERLASGENVKRYEIKGYIFLMEHYLGINETERDN